MICVFYWQACLTARDKRKEGRDRKWETGRSVEMMKRGRGKGTLNHQWSTRAVPYQVFFDFFFLLSCMTRIHKEGAANILCHRRHGKKCGAKCFHSWFHAEARRGGLWLHRRIHHQSLTTRANHMFSFSSSCQSWI